ncbi:transmembrane amino acid transporter protein-domain-containing protein [Massariosphaeria phaeospora]|uniref:Transmembrane amino acid transporter protein-domain-containing protein n=1 Tax=Massariosphaeria phaeospora TaxID=100035 RepID=A0A7C8IG78_9PLEO|nr:transmembrane amino acid transporter protein-domain-containing protein [Massariosphaeria phaeospora]
MADDRPESSSPRAVPSPSRDSGRSSSPAPDEAFSRAQSMARLGSPVPSFPSNSPAVRQIPTPAQFGAEETSQSGTPLPGRSDVPSSLPAPGESALSSALRDSFGRGSPPRFGTPPLRALSPEPESSTGYGPSSNYGSFDGRGRSPTAPYEDPEIIRRHLAGPQKPSISNLSGQYGSPSRSQRGWIEEEESQSRDPTGSSDSEEFSSLQLQGGDITRQIYRWSEQQEAEGRQKNTRSRSFHASRPRPDDKVLDIDTIKQPGGFRRNYLRRAAASPSPAPGPSRYGTVGQSRPQPPVFTSNFLEFLTLYGHFAGESLEEDDEILGPDEYFSSDALDSGVHSEDEEREYGESSALLTPGKRRKRRPKQTGNASPTGASLLLLKSFVGTGVLFLPRAFLNGGMLFSNLVLLGVAGLSYYCFVLLVSTRLVIEHSFGDMGYHLYGNWMRNMINFSLVISQIGFSSAYIVFVSENLQAFTLAVTDCRTNIDIKYMILIQMIIFLPLSLYRNINNIQKLALIADVFILLGLVYLYYFDILTIVIQGGVADIINFNSSNWTLFIGTAIFTFEGIGLIIPIQTGMKDPRKFPAVLGGVMIIITVIFLSMGALSYAAFGSKTKTVVILNMPQDSKFVNGVQLIYSLAILLSTPLQIYPAIEITSQQLFSRTGKYNPYIKWKKNFFRFFMVMVCAMIAWGGANDLDKFVSLVGSFACIPLVYIYPPMLHYKALARSSASRALDVALCILGLVGMVYTTSLTVSSWVGGGAPKPPGYCDSR